MYSAWIVDITFFGKSLRFRLGIAVPGGIVVAEMEASGDNDQKDRCK